MLSQRSLATIVQWLCGMMVVWILVLPASWLLAVLPDHLTHAWGHAKAFAAIGPVPGDVVLKVGKRCVDAQSGDSMPVTNCQPTNNHVLRHWARSTKVSPLLCCYTTCHALGGAWQWGCSSVRS
jgi:hypothetical protein